MPSSISALAPHAGRVDEADRARRRSRPRCRSRRGSCPAGRARPTRSSPISRLNSVDLPTFGPPDDARRREHRPLRARRSTVGARPPSVVGRRAGATTTASSRSPVPRPCSALTGNGSPSPSDTNSQIVGLAAGRRRPCWRRRSTGRLDAAQQLGHAGVLLGDADGGVDHEQHDVGLARWPARPARLTFASSVAATGQPAAGVDQHGTRRPATRPRAPCGRG